MVAPNGKDELNIAKLLRHKQDRKELEWDPVSHLVAVSSVKYCAMDRKEQSATLSKITSYPVS